VLFRSSAALRHVYPQLVTHAIQRVSSRDVMRFLGKKVVPVTKTNPLGIHGNFQGEVITDLGERCEGVRIKHRVNGNWVKMYDKQGSVLRVETVINDGRDLRVFRRAEGDTQSPKRWHRLRKGIADARRRAVLSQQANTRYLDTLAAVEVHQPLATMSCALCRRVRWQGRSVRALNPLNASDGALLTAIYRGDFVLTGFRNRDLQQLRIGSTASAVTRQLRLLRAHGLIRKVPRTHRYLLTDRGRVVIAALLAARRADIATLAKAA
jgi:DNA-binding MarR family transcriptional regulator